MFLNILHSFLIFKVRDVKSIAVSSGAERMSFLYKFTLLLAQKKMFKIILHPVGMTFLKIMCNSQKLHS